MQRSTLLISGAEKRECRLSYFVYATDSKDGVKDIGKKARRYRGKHFVSSPENGFR